ncbi:acetolactate synthase small subunit [Anaerocolumna chitinilytica]|uniref:Acetolactate synthase small subunit n=1 Tax=Anaerocolumna chitinilytica TaxID=1727145 RepID=A0A7M3S9M4_9FIRM|nr:acetolactate synthase small subunit [Anaerocolumna chitinilytica]BCK01292.1 acetolactate synthase small subunit [Anaerocolumna chitinilytica]
MGKVIENIIKKRWISLYVENEIGVLAKISGLFSGKSYNMDSLTVGETEDETISRMTISVTSDESTFEQIKKQLNRCVEVIKVVDFTDIPIHMKEILFVKINSLKDSEKEEVFSISKIYGLAVIDCDRSTLLLECVQTESKNNAIIKLFQNSFPNRIEVVKGGSVAIEAISVADR